MAEPEELFDRYDRFYQRSNRRRLIVRHRVLIADHAELFEDRRVLDLASHDGRWTFAAIQAGARFALGIEGRESHVLEAHANLEHYEIDGSRYEFIQGDAMENLRKLADDSFDVALCFGFLYHCHYQIDLLAHLDRIGCKTIIIDTNVAPRFKDVDAPLFQLNFDPVEDHWSAIEDIATRQGRQPLLIPNTSALSALLSHGGYDCRLLDWKAHEEELREDMEEYLRGDRISLLATKAA